MPESEEQLLVVIPHAGINLAYLTTSLLIGKGKGIVCERNQQKNGENFKEARLK